MTDFEVKILSNAKPRILEYEALFIGKELNGDVIIPIASFDGAVDRLRYDKKSRKIVEVAYQLKIARNKIIWKTIGLVDIDWGAIPDPPHIIPTWGGA